MIVYALENKPLDQLRPAGGGGGPAVAVEYPATW